MESILQAIEDWFRNLLVSGIMNNIQNTFRAINRKVGEVTTLVGTQPADFAPDIYSMIQTLSENVIMPIAGLVLTFIACYELIQLVISHNNLANFETWIFWKWIFKTAIAVTLITNTMNITMAVFDVAQHVVNESGSIISGSVKMDDSDFDDIEEVLEEMDIGPLMVIFLQTFVVQFVGWIMSMLIVVIVYARMIEIYMMTSLAPIPFATFGNREQSMMGQNYLRSLFALGFQGFLMMVCVGIYALLIHRITFTSDIVGSLWEALGYMVLLVFSLFKTGSVAKSILHAH